MSSNITNNLVNSISNLIDDNTDGPWNMSKSIIVLSKGTASTTPQNFDISEYIPVDGYDYELNMGLMFKTANAGSAVSLTVPNGSVYLATRSQAASVNMETSGTLVLKDGNRIITLVMPSGSANNVNFSISGYRRLGKSLI